MTNFDRIKTMNVDELVDEILLNVPDDSDTRFIFGSWKNRQQIKEYLESEFEGITDEIYNKVKDKLPPIGVPLIVTVKDHLQGKPNELRYPVYYEKSKSGHGYRWSWRYGDFDYELLPDVSEVIAYMLMPEPYQERGMMNND